MKKWTEKDFKYIWHPYTQMKDCQDLPPIFIKKAKGIKIYDENNKMYYDTISSWWCNIHGHNHQMITQAIKKQIKSLDHVLFAGFTHKPAILLAENLLDVAPENLKKVFFSDNGSTAVEAALKMSFQYWQNKGKKEKKLFVCLDHGYHGDTIGAMSVSGDSIFNEPFKPLLFSSIKADSPYCYRCPEKKLKKDCKIECFQSLESIVKKQNKKICGLILEPLLMAAGGMIIYPPDYLIKAAQLTKKYNIHLIVDEIATGFGRTGKMFACDYGNIYPDFLCLSKGITSGVLPLGATLTTNEIYNAFYDDYDKKKTFFHGHTFTANPISCSAAVASLKIFKKENTLKKVQSIIPFFHNQMEKFRNMDFVGDVRYIGMVGAIELVKNKETKEPFDFTERIGYKLYKKGLQEGIILRPLGNIIYLFLPLSISQTDLEYILNKTEKILKNLLKVENI
jgi:adenosylmethionine-8-amino-7-oxononanoate aminotransferase